VTPDGTARARRVGMAPGPGRFLPFASLRHRNFRLFFTGQLISLIGTWMQRIAQSWLVLQITNSPFLLGLIGALQWLPVLLLSLVGGVTADRMNKRSLLVVTQTLQMLQAFALGFLVLTGTVRFWHVAALAVILGLTSAFDIPARQAFIFDMVDSDHIMNAVALNSTIFNAARLFGPAVAGLAIGTVGMAWAFLANGVSFLAVIAAFLMMRVRPVDHGGVQSAASGLLDHLREGLIYVRRTPITFQVILLVAAESIFVMNFTTIVPVFARDVLRQQATGYGLLMSSQGAGALIGALFVASLSYLGPRPVFLFGGAALLSLANLLLGASHLFWAAAAVLGLAGGSMVLFTANANTMLQVNSPDYLRGRVMSMYSIVMGGVTPAGALLTGTLAQFWGASTALAVGGIAGLASLGIVLRWRVATRPDILPYPVAIEADGGSGDETAAGEDGSR
jgi:predicted MFS family arabinose efflux permease